MADSKPITATVAVLRAGQPIRTDPRMTSSNVSFTLPAHTMISLAFSVTGDEYLGSTLWYGYFLNSGGRAGVPLQAGGRAEAGIGNPRPAARVA